jgi:hypothetical protein
MLLTYELKRNNSLLNSELSSCRAQQDKAADGSVSEACDCSNTNEATGAGAGDAMVELERVKRERDSMRRERDEALLKLVECQLKAAPSTSSAGGAGGVGGAQEEAEAAFAAAAIGEAACCSQTCNAEC